MTGLELQNSGVRGLHSDSCVAAIAESSLNVDFPSAKSTIVVLLRINAPFVWKTLLATYKKIIPSTNQVAEKFSQFCKTRLIH